MISVNSVVFSKNISEKHHVDPSVQKPLGEVGILALCPISAVAVKRMLDGMNIDAKLLIEDDVMLGYASDMVNFDIIFVTENDKTSLIQVFKVSQTVRDLSSAHIVLMSSRSETHGLTEAFNEAYDAVAKFPIHQDTLSYVMRRLTNSNNFIRRSRFVANHGDEERVPGSGWLIVSSAFFGLAFSAWFASRFF